MTQTVQFEGQSYQFPDDATDEEIAAALEGEQQGAAGNPLSAEAFARSSAKPGEELRSADTSVAGLLYSKGKEAASGFVNRLNDIEGAIPGLGPLSEADRKTAESLGIPRGTIDTNMGRFGQTLADNALLEAATLGVGGLVGGTAARQVLPKVLPGLRKEIGGLVESYATAPGRHAAQTVVGTAGQVAGEGTAGKDQGGGMAGYLIGANAGNIAAKGVKAVGGAAVSAGRAAGEATGLLKPKPKQFTVLEKNPDMLAPVHAAEDRVAGEIAQYQTKAQDLVKKFAPTYSKRPGAAPSVMRPEVANARFEDARSSLESSMVAREQQLWSDAVRGRVQIAGAQTDVRTLQQELMKSDPEATIPDDVMSEVLGWKGYVSPKKIQGMITNIGQMRTKLRKDPSFRGDWRRLSANMAQVQDILQSALEAGVTDKAKLAAARSFTQARKGIFTDGPMGEAKYQSGQGSTTFTVPGSATEQTLNFSREPQAQTILGTTGGPQQVSAAQQMANATGTPSTIMNDFENTVRAEFTDYVQTKVPVSGKPNQMGEVDPAQAERWWRKNRAKITSMKNLATDLDQTVNGLQVLDNMVQKVRGSSYAKLAAGGPAANPEPVVRRMFSDPHRVKVARELTSTFRKDPKAMEAWHSYVVDELFRLGKGDPEEVLRLLSQDNKYKAILGEVFKYNPERLDTLNRLLPAMVNYAKGDQPGGTRKVVKGAVRLVSGILGAGAGRFLNTGTVQVPGQTAKGFRGFAERAMNYIMPDAAKVMSYALIDPKIAKMLLGKYSPRDGADAIRQALIFSRRLNGIIASTYSLENSPPEEK